MISPHLFLAAVAGVLSASMAMSSGNTTMRTVVKVQMTTLTGVPRAAPSAWKRWTGDCEKYCSELEGNQYYPCMHLCEQRLGSNTDTDSPESSDFAEDGKVPWYWATTDSPSTSDYDNFHHKRGLSARNCDDDDDRSESEKTDEVTETMSESEKTDDVTETMQEDVMASVTAILDRINGYSSAYHQVLSVRNAVSKPSDAEQAPRRIGGEVDEWMGEWVVGVRDRVHGKDEAKMWEGLLVRYVLASETATAKYFARRLEVVARKETEREVKRLVKGLSTKARRSVRGEVRGAWGQQFGERVWGPKGVLAAVDFE